MSRSRDNFFSEIYSFIRRATEGMKPRMAVLAFLIAAFFSYGFWQNLSRTLLRSNAGQHSPSLGGETTSVFNFLVAGTLSVVGLAIIAFFVAVAVAIISRRLKPEQNN